MDGRDYWPLGTALHCDFFSSLLLLPRVNLGTDSVGTPFGDLFVSRSAINLSVSE